MTAESRTKLQHNPHIKFIETPYGGHCAFMARSNGDGDDGRWAEKRLIQFIASVAEGK
jgi:predicted alpha/beta-fold hydrolase